MHFISLLSVVCVEECTIINIITSACKDALSFNNTDKYNMYIQTHVQCTYIYYLQCALRKVIKEVIICILYVHMYVLKPMHYKCKLNADLIN